jgi:hypothetical protein
MEKPVVKFLGATYDNMHVFDVDTDSSKYLHTLIPNESGTVYPMPMKFIVRDIQIRCGRMILDIQSVDGGLIYARGYHVNQKFMDEVCPNPKPVYKYTVDTPVNGACWLVRGEVTKLGVQYKSSCGGLRADNLNVRTWHDTPQQAMDAYLKVLQQRFEMHSQSLREQVEGMQ